MNKKEILKDYIISTGHTTDCTARMFFEMNPKTIQPFMEINGMIGEGNKKYEMLENVLNEIENERKNCTHKVTESFVEGLIIK